MQEKPDRVLELPHLNKVWKPNKAGGTLHCYYGREANAPKLGEVKAETRRDAEHLLHDEPDAVLTAYIEVKRPPISTGNVSGMILSYRADPEFKKLASSTQDTWNIYIDNDIVPKIGHLTRRDLDKPTSTAWFRNWRKEYENTPAKANTMLTILKQVFKFALINGWINRNPVDLLKPLPEKDRSDIIWQDWELLALLKAARPNISWAIRFCALTGLRRSDALRATWSDIVDNQIRIRTNKKKALAIIPITPQLQALLDEIGRPENEIHTPIIKNTLGTSYKPNSITQGLIKARNELRKLNPNFAYDVASKTNKRLHDLRGTHATKQFARILADSDIAEKMGWLGTKAAPKYIDPIIALDIARTNKKQGSQT